MQSLAQQGRRAKAVSQAMSGTVDGPFPRDDERDELLALDHRRSRLHPQPACRVNRLDRAGSHGPDRLAGRRQPGL